MSDPTTPTRGVTVNDPWELVAPTSSAAILAARAQQQNEAQAAEIDRSGGLVAFLQRREDAEAEARAEWATEEEQRKAREFAGRAAAERARLAEISRQLEH